MRAGADLPAHLPVMSTHPAARIQAGTPAGGQFATSARAEPDIDLGAPPAPTASQYEAEADTGYSRLTAITTVREGLHARESTIAAASLCALVRSVYPTAQTITTGECDQGGCERQHVETIVDGDGNELSDTYDDAYAQIESDVFDLESGVDAFDESSRAFVDLAGSERSGYTSTLRIDAARTARESLSLEPGARGAATIASYRAVHDDLDLDDATAARDMLTDLHHWARSAGVDLESVFAAAGEVADEEDAPSAALPDAGLAR